MPIDTMPDAAANGAATIRALLEPRTEPYATGVTIGTQRPEDTLAADKLPYGIVAVDGAAVEIDHTARPNLRVTFWHHDRDAAFDLAALTYGLILTAPRGGFEQPHDVIPPYRDRDLVTRQDIASFTVQVAMPTAQIL